MTREEAIEKIIKSMECHDRKVCGLAETCEECPLYVDKDTEYEAHKVLISALSQECVESTQKHIGNALDMRCDDAISREYLKKIAQSEGAYGYVSAHDIATAPSVTHKSGKWILTDDDFVYCSECEDSYYPRPIDASWYYCPHCGADMRGAE